MQTVWLIIGWMFVENNKVEEWEYSQKIAVGLAIGIEPSTN